MAERITEIITAELFGGAGDRLGGHEHEGLGRGPSGAYGEGSGRPRTARAKAVPEGGTEVGWFGSGAQRSQELTRRRT